MVCSETELCEAAAVAVAARWKMIKDTCGKKSKSTVKCAAKLSQN